MIFRSDKKTPAEFCHSAEKGHVWIKVSNYLLTAIYVTASKKAVKTFPVKLLKIIF